MEYVLADSAYTLSETIMTPFKTPSSLRPENVAFNQILSSVRVKVEHAIGFCKIYFKVLHGARRRIREKESAHEAVFWVKACVILHNMLLKLDEWEGVEASRDLPSIIMENCQLI